MDASMSTAATPAPAATTFYCETCRIPFAGKKEFDRHMKRAKAHFPSGITCYHPECSKTYQKWESLYTHVGRDHREEIEALLLESFWTKKVVCYPQQYASGGKGVTFPAGTQNIVDNAQAWFQQMPGNASTSSDATTPAAHEAGLSTNSTAFAGPQHMFEGYPPYTMNAAYSSNQEMHRPPQWPYATAHSDVGMPAASSLLPSNSSQLGASSAPTAGLDHTYPPRGMLPTSYGQGTLAMGAAYSDAYMGGPNTMLDDGAEISDYIG